MKLFATHFGNKEATVTCWDNYHPPMKLREGNVFSRVCLFMGGLRWPSPMMHWTSLYNPPPIHGPGSNLYKVPTASVRTPASPWTGPHPCHWNMVAITGDVFKHVHFRIPLLPNADIWWLVAEAHTVGERVARILLECILVFNLNKKT